MDMKTENGDGSTNTHRQTLAQMYVQIHDYKI